MKRVLCGAVSALCTLVLVILPCTVSVSAEEPPITVYNANYETPLPIEATVYIEQNNINAAAPAPSTSSTPQTTPAATTTAVSTTAATTTTVATTVATTPAYNTEDLYNDIEGLGNQDSDFNIENAIIEPTLDWATSMFRTIGSFVAVFGTAQTPWGMNVNDMVAKYSPFFQTVAYTLIVLLFGINFISQATQGELISIKGIIKMLGGILIAKIWVDLSVKICLGILSFTSSLTGQIVVKSTDITIFSVTVYPNCDCGLWLVGKVIDFFTNLLTLLPMLLCGAVVGICSIIVCCKLIMRTFEITLLTSISPVFFACLVGDATKAYFKRFVSEFLSAALSVLWMALIYVFALEWLQSLNLSVIDEWGDLGMYFGRSMPKVLIIVVMSVFMVKPPSIFKNLISV